MPTDSNIQRIERLTPLADVLNGFQTGVEPVEPQEEALANALGLTLAADVALAEGQPKAPLALRDGFAVRSDATLDASSYAPVPLSPRPQRIDLGDTLPDDTDAVAPFDAVTEHGEITMPMAPGDGVLAPGGDAPAGTLRLGGARLRRIDVALMQTLGVERVLIREAHVRLVGLGTTAAAIANAIEADGGTAVTDGLSLDEALQRIEPDAIVGIGGTGSGRNDNSVRTLAKHGRVDVHGIGIMPGETTAVGFVGTCPVLLLPGRLDAALAGWLTVGRRLLARLNFRMIEEQPFSAELSRKVSSPLGVAEVVPVRRRFSTVEPLASGHLSAQTLAKSDGWILIPADSEGYPAGAKVPVRPWP